ncbi:thermonuclease family protein [Alteriqipengyuania flavescens]|uniref:thermonuclease family protein n=1 Tax=Alteriqipengyuania flavescens TaxID=3053610 RepID=UPI0025B4C67B|nr:thermonuclease family protein [Alteriqipengyuania flavescens]WJY24627.1 thermonuclease family protein [Alteriqipengyuania flavescens]
MLTVFFCLSAVVVDGDTLRCANVADANGRVRLARIDAPERGETGFAEAGDALAAMIAGRQVRCELVDADPRINGFQERDRFGRPVARCATDQGDLGERLLARGHARRWP